VWPSDGAPAEKEGTLSNSVIGKDSRRKLKGTAVLALLILGMSAATVIARAQAPTPTEVPGALTFVGEIALVDFLPEEVVPGEDCGGGNIVLTVNPEGTELLSVEVRGFRVAGVSSTLVVPLGSGQVPIAKDGSFSISEPLPVLPTFTAAILGQFDFSADPASVVGTLGVSLTASGIIVCETPYSAVFSEEGLPPLATPTPMPTFVPLPGALTFVGTIQSTRAVGPTGVDLGPCGGGEVGITISGDGTSVLRVEVTGFVLFGSPAQRIVSHIPGEVPIDPDDGSFQSEREQVDPATGQGTGIIDFVEGMTDFDADPATVSGTLGTRGVAVCEADFSAATAGGPAVGGLPATGGGPGAGSDSGAVLWVVLAAALGAFGLATMGLAIMRRRGA
jgi:hypothetical protein